MDAGDNSLNSRPRHKFPSPSPPRDRAPPRPRDRLPGRPGDGTSGVAMADPKISSQQVRHVARLSRLALDDDELERFGAQLESILGYVAKIDQADVTGVEPMAHAANLKNVLRDDVVEPALPAERVLQNAPETDGPFFKVPKVIGGDEDSAG